jgi:hypothetical protein
MDFFNGVQVGVEIGDKFKNGFIKKGVEYF